MKPTQQPLSKGAEEARQQLPTILAAAAAGQSTLITRHGRAVAAVVPASALSLRKPVSLLTLAGTGQHLWGEDSSRAIDTLREEWNR